MENNSPKNNQISTQKQKYLTKELKKYDMFEEVWSGYREMMQLHLDSFKNSIDILDSGAGTGKLTRRLLEMGHNVVAIDNNQCALDVLREKCHDVNKGKLLVSNVDVSHPLPFKDKSFGGVASSLIMPFVFKHYEEYLAEVYRVLKAKGVLSLSMILPRKGVVANIWKELESDAKKQGLLPEHQIDFEEVYKISKKNEEFLLTHKVSQKDLLKALKECGFSKIEIPNKLFDDNLFLIRAHKI